MFRQSDWPLGNRNHLNLESNMSHDNYNIACMLPAHFMCMLKVVQISSIAKYQAVITTTNIIMIYYYS